MAENVSHFCQNVTLQDLQLSCADKFEQEPDTSTEWRVQCKPADPGYSHGWSDYFISDNEASAIDWLDDLFPKEPDQVFRIVKRTTTTKDEIIQ